jgi:hypothetical protein
MSTELEKKTVVELDGFDSYTNQVDGEEDFGASGRVIQGIKISFLDPRWLDNDERDITGKLLTAINVVNVVTKWGHDNKPLEPPRVLAPGEKFPNFAELNAKCPQSEWRERFGKVVGPWAGQHVIYFIDSLEPVTTIGSAICVREFTDQVRLVRKFNGLVYPVCELGHTDWKTGFGLKQRPYLLNIKKWIKLSSDQLPPPDSNPEIAPPAAEGALGQRLRDAKTEDRAGFRDGAVEKALEAEKNTTATIGEPVTLKEATDDSIPW